MGAKIVESWNVKVEIVEGLIRNVLKVGRNYIKYVLLLYSFLSCVAIRVSQPLFLHSTEIFINVGPCPKEIFINVTIRQYF